MDNVERIATTFCDLKRAGVYVGSKYKPVASMDGYFAIYKSNAGIENCGFQADNFSDAVNMAWGWAVAKGIL